MTDPTAIDPPMVIDPVPPTERRVTEREMAQRLRRQARDLKITQNELARKVGMNPGQFSRFLNGKIPPGPRILRFLKLKQVYVEK